MNFSEDYKEKYYKYKNKYLILREKIEGGYRPSGEVYIYYNYEELKTTIGVLENEMKEKYNNEIEILKRKENEEILKVHGDEKKIKKVKEGYETERNKNEKEYKESLTKFEELKNLMLTQYDYCNSRDKTSGLGLRKAYPGKETKIKWKEVSNIFKVSINNIIINGNNINTFLPSDIILMILSNLKSLLYLIKPFITDPKKLNIINNFDNYVPKINTLIKKIRNLDTCLRNLKEKRLLLIDKTAVLFQEDRCKTNVETFEEHVKKELEILNNQDCISVKLDSCMRFKVRKGENSIYFNKKLLNLKQRNEEIENENILKKIRSSSIATESPELLKISDNLEQTIPRVDIATVELEGGFLGLNELIAGFKIIFSICLILYILRLIEDINLEDINSSIEKIPETNVSINLQKVIKDLSDINKQVIELEKNVKK